VNEAAVTRYGYSRERFLEMTLFDVVAPDQHHALRASIRARARGEAAGPSTWRQLTSDGTELFVQPFVQRLIYEGRPALISSLFDVTLRKRAEEAVAEARDVAQAASRAKGEFLANMSHEIRTPLNGVTGVAQVLARTNLTPHQREMVELICASASNLERLMSDILDLSRVESGRMAIDAEPFDLRETVRSVAAVSEMRAREKGVAFELRVSPAVNRPVVGDAGRLKQILNNLLSNAVKFTHAGLIRLEVAEATDQPGAYTFTVTDTGVGFCPETAGRLFRRFEQEDGSITRRFGGSGLGLAISRDLAELMGGAVSACSTPGEGSTFTVRLPLPDADAPLQPVWEAAPAFVETEGRPLRVLLAEDHPTNQKVVELLLATMGAELTCVENGEEAVLAAADQPFDVVLMDMQMPVMDGLTAIRLIRAAERAGGRRPLPIFTLSANAMTEHAEASMAAGADRHLTKPISAAVLLGALGEVAEQVALREAA
jgi:PAS domain S-box-containing protein